MHLRDVLGLFLLAGLSCSGGGNDNDPVADDDDSTVNDDDLTANDDDITADDDDLRTDDDNLPGCVPDGSLPADGAPFVQSLRVAFLANPAQEVGVAWKSGHSMCGAVVEMGSSPDRLDRTIVPEEEVFDGLFVPIGGDDENPSTEKTYVYQAWIEGLEPERTYHYRVTFNGRSTDVLPFSTAPERGSVGPVEFIVLGDNRGPADGTPTPAAVEVVNQVALHSFDFILNTGDMTRSSLQGEWDGYFQNAEGLIESKPWLLCRGNHDSKTPKSFFRNAFLPYRDVEEERAFYSMDIGNVHVISLDSEDFFLGAPEITPQLPWLRADLEATDQDWIIVFFHQSAYNSSQSHGSIELMQRAFVDLFDEFGVDVAYMGHDHIYDRTRFLYGRSALTPENKLPEGGGYRPAEMCDADCTRGTLYVTSGGAGAGTYEVFDPPLAHSAVSKSVHHFIKVRIDGDQYHHEAIDSLGNVIDTVEFTRIHRR